MLLESGTPRRLQPWVLRTFPRAGDVRAESRRSGKSCLGQGVRSRRGKGKTVFTRGGSVACGRSGRKGGRRSRQVAGMLGALDLVLKVKGPGGRARAHSDGCCDSLDKVETEGSDWGLGRGGWARGRGSPLWPGCPVRWRLRRSADSGGGWGQVAVPGFGPMDSGVSEPAVNSGRWWGWECDLGGVSLSVGWRLRPSLWPGCPGNGRPVVKMCGVDCGVEGQSRQQ